MRLIDADELIESIEETTWYHVFKGKLIHGANSKTDIPLYKASDIYSVLDAAPTIDAVPVVRCKNCGAYQTMDVSFPRCRITGRMKDIDDYCSSGYTEDSE